MKQFSEIYNIVYDNLPNVKEFAIPDSTYGCPNSSWIKYNLYRSYSNWLWNQGLYEWKEYFDCDDYAILFKVFCHICHAKTQKIRQKQGLPTYESIAVGVMYYKSYGTGAEQAGIGHAINCIITENGMEFFEPQNGTFLNLTEKEKNSCFFVYM
jgi:hypothetical protein